MTSDSGFAATEKTANPLPDASKALDARKVLEHTYYQCAEIETSLRLRNRALPKEEAREKAADAFTMAFEWANRIPEKIPITCLLPPLEEAVKNMKRWLVGVGDFLMSNEFRKRVWRKPHDLRMAEAQRVAEKAEIDGARPGAIATSHADRLTRMFEVMDAKEQVRLALRSLSADERKIVVSIFRTQDLPYESKECIAVPDLAREMELSTVEAMRRYEMAVRKLRKLLPKTSRPPEG
jgi:hypothetical protein